MRQVVLERLQHLRVTEAPRPAPGVGEVLVRVKATAICGSDLLIYNGGMAAPLPRVIGHECAGTIEELGKDVSGFSPGDAVTLNPNLSCGGCELCRLGRENLCPHGQIMGREADGFLREYVAVPQPLAFKLPSHVSFGEGALVQPLSTVVHAQRRAGIDPSETVVVLGQGTTGLLHTRLAKLAGAGVVIAVGRSPWKLELGRQMGADHLVNATEGDPVTQVSRLTGGWGADVVIEAVGSPDTVHQALEMVKPGGRVIQYGVSPQVPHPLDLYRLYLKETLLLFPRAMTGADFSVAVDLLASGRVDLKPLITREYLLEETAQAFRFVEENHRQVLRLIIKP